MNGLVDRPEAFSLRHPSTTYYRGSCGVGHIKQAVKQDCIRSGEITQQRNMAGEWRRFKDVKTMFVVGDILERVMA